MSGWLILNATVAEWLEYQTSKIATYYLIVLILVVGYGLVAGTARLIAWFRRYR